MTAGPAMRHLLARAGGALRRRGRRFRADRRGSATVEFVIVFPVFAFMLCSAVESGILMLRQVSLDRAIDLAIRDLRLKVLPVSSNDPVALHAAVKARVCESALMIPDCADTILLEMRQIEKGGALPSTRAPCVDRLANEQADPDFQAGIDNQMMLLRACAVFDPLFPGAGLGLDLTLDESGAYALTSASAFVIEPS